MKQRKRNRQIDALLHPTNITTYSSSHSHLPSMSIGPAIELEEEEEDEEADLDSCLASSSVVAMITPSLGLGGKERGRESERERM